MCRYELCRYKDRYACFTCRKCFKTTDGKRETISKAKEGRKCPECAEFMSWVGKDFKPPLKQKVKEWEKLEHITKVLKFNWGSCGCDGPGKLPFERIRKGRLND